MDAPKSDALKDLLAKIDAYEAARHAITTAVAEKRAIGEDDWARLDVTRAAAVGLAATLAPPADGSALRLIRALGSEVLQRRG
jgi:hypothetical protein